MKLHQTMNRQNYRQTIVKRIKTRTLLSYIKYISKIITRLFKPHRIEVARRPTQTLGKVLSKSKEPKSDGNRTDVRSANFTNWSKDLHQTGSEAVKCHSGYYSAYGYEKFPSSCLVLPTFMLGGKR